MDGCNDPKKTSSGQLLPLLYKNKCSRMREFLLCLATLIWY
jgi:hypothetical protein